MMSFGDGIEDYKKAYALNKQCPVTGGKHAPNKYYAPNSEVRLITRVYSMAIIRCMNFQCFQSIEW